MAIGTVAMFITVGIMVRWFMVREAKTAAEALVREQSLRTEIKEVADFARTTLTDLVTKSTVAMNSVAEATRSCLARQNAGK